MSETFEIKEEINHDFSIENLIKLSFRTSKFHHYYVERNSPFAHIRKALGRVNLYCLG